MPYCHLDHLRPRIVHQGPPLSGTPVVRSCPVLCLISASFTFHVDEY